MNQITQMEERERFKNFINRYSTMLTDTSYQVVVSEGRLARSDHPIVTPLGNLTRQP